MPTVTYPKILSVTPVGHDHLRVVFSNHITKLYDCAEVLRHSAFSALSDPAIFRAVRVDQGGYGIFWNDELDLSEAELWIHGKTLQPES